MTTAGGAMPTAAWRRLEALFEAAIERPASERGPFLDEACSADRALRARLDRLLAAHEAMERGAGRTGFLDALDAPRAAALLHGSGSGPGAGEKVGRYRVVRRLARGGMGLVYLARDPALDRLVALKLLPGHLSADTDANRRLLSEARAASALDHPHIATVFEVGETDDDRLFIAMAYYDGETLRERLAGGPLPVGAAVDVAAQVADGLAAAHGQGIVHRDIKPENLVFDGRGTVKIVDFGVARMAASAATGAGATRGTVAYMSPEQTRGGAVDHRTDVWSLGVVLYEMLTGRRPFGGETNEALIHGIRNDAPTPVRDLRPGVPPAVAAIVERCLEPDAAGRFGSAADLRDALRATRATDQGTGAPGMSQRTLWKAAAAYVAVAWVAYQGFGYAAGRFLLPGWVQDGALLLLLLGLPVILATGRRLLPPELWNWPRAIAGGAAAFLVLVVLGGSIVMRGLPRVTEARGVAGDAFAERGWVVIADFAAPPELTDVALAAREALAVDLQQSGFVNVVGRSQVTGVLQRMGLPGTEPLDLTLALDVAQRSGAGAVLTATVSQLGPQFVLTGRAVRAATGDDLFAVRTAAGSDRLLGAVETLSHEMRRRLGEERDAIRQSRPLPDVTTPSLPALKLYAEAGRVYTHDIDRAANLAAEAIRLDSTFAMAHRMAGIIAGNQLQFGESRAHLARAYAFRDRLTERERRHVEAAYHIGAALEPGRSADALELLLVRYPDDAPATANLGAVLHGWLGAPERAYPLVLRAVDLDPHSMASLANAVEVASVTGRAAVADSLAELARERGFAEFAARWRIGLDFARGDQPAVAAACDSLLDGPARPMAGADDRELCGSMDIAAGRLRQGVARLESVERTYLDARRHRNAAHAAQAMAAAEVIRGDPARAATRIVAILERMPVDAVPEPDRFITRTNLRLQAALLERPDLVERIARAYPAYPDPDHWFGRYGEALVDAALAVAADDGEVALAILRERLPRDRHPIGWRIWNELLRGLAFEAVGQPDSAAVRYERAADPGYHPAPYLTKDRIYLPFALRRLAEVEAHRGNTERAADAYRRLLDLWADADPELDDEVEALRAALRRLTATGD